MNNKNENENFWKLGLAMIAWIRQISSNNSIFYCNVCNKDFSCNSSHVSRHTDSTCHKKNIYATFDMNKEQRPVKKNLNLNGLKKNSSNYGYVKYHMTTVLFHV